MVPVSASLFLAGGFAAALAWVAGVGVVFPFPGALRQIIEHRSLEAREPALRQDAKLEFARCAPVPPPLVGRFPHPRHFVLFQRRSLEALALECGLEAVSFSYTQGAPFWSVSPLEELRKLGLVKITAERPAIAHPLVPMLQAGSAAFDFLRRPFAPLSQMEIVLKPAE